MLHFNITNKPKTLATLCCAGLLGLAFLGLSGCSDQSKSVIDFNLLDTYKKSVHPVSSLVVTDNRSMADRVHRELEKGTGFYLGDAQLVPDRITLFKEYLASHNVSSTSNIVLTRFDIMVVFDPNGAKDFGQFLGQMGDALATGATVGLVSGVTGIDPSITSIVLDPKVEVQKFCVVCKLSALVDKKMVQVVTVTPFNAFNLDADGERRYKAFETLQTIFSKFETQLREKISTSNLEKRNTT